MSWIEKKATFTANGALGARVRVKLTSGSATDPPQVEVAGAADGHIGYTEYAAASGELVAVVGRFGNMVQEAVASAAIAVGAALEGAAAGKVATKTTGTLIGYAVEAATADGDIVKIIDAA